MSQVTGAFNLLSRSVFNFNSIAPHLTQHLFELRTTFGFISIFVFVSVISVSSPCALSCVPLSSCHVAAMSRRVLKQENGRFEDISGWLNWKNVIGTNTGCSTGANKTILPEQIQSTESLTVVTATKTLSPRGWNHFMIPFQRGTSGKNYWDMVNMIAAIWDGNLLDKCGRNLSAAFNVKP